MLMAFRRNRHKEKVCRPAEGLRSRALQRSLNLLQGKSSNLPVSNFECRDLMTSALPVPEAQQSPAVQEPNPGQAASNCPSFTPATPVPAASSYNSGQQAGSADPEPEASPAPRHHLQVQPEGIKQGRNCSNDLPACPSVPGAPCTQGNAHQRDRVPLLGLRHKSSPDQQESQGFSQLRHMMASALARPLRSAALPADPDPWSPRQHCRSRSRTLPEHESFTAADKAESCTNASQFSDVSQPHKTLLYLNHNFRRSASLQSPEANIKHKKSTHAWLCDAADEVQDQILPYNFHQDMGPVTVDEAFFTSGLDLTALPCGHDHFGSDTDLAAPIHRAGAGLVSPISDVQSHRLRSHSATRKPQTYHVIDDNGPSANFGSPLSSMHSRSWLDSPSAGSITSGDPADEHNSELEELIAPPGTRHPRASVPFPGSVSPLSPNAVSAGWDSAYILDETLTLSPVASTCGLLDENLLDATISVEQQSADDGSEYSLSSNEVAFTESDNEFEPSLGKLCDRSAGGIGSGTALSFSSERAQLWNALDCYAAHRPWY